MSIEQLRQQANAFFQRGEIPQAIERMIELVNRTPADATIQDYKLLSLYLFSLGDFEAALQIMKVVLAKVPEDLQALVNVGVCLNRLQRQGEAVVYLEKSLEQIRPDTAADVVENLYDALAHACYKIERHDEAIGFGRRSLEYKDRQVAPKKPLRLPRLKAFDKDKPNQNVIAFSLWGDAQRYCLGAIENARVAPLLFPEWRCRFYCDSSVPEWVVGQLLAYGADIVMAAEPRRLHEGLFWRFQVANDAAVDRFLVRDVDSVFSLRERMAVNEWLDSGKAFHLMRDFYTHTDLILAGMWGGVAGILPDIATLAEPYISASDKTRNCDQAFLRREIWPLIKPWVLIHDDYFGCFEARPFPEYANKLPIGYVGQGLLPLTLIDKGSVDTSRSEFKQREHILFCFSTGRSGTLYLSKLLSDNLIDAEVHHERTGHERMGLDSPDASHFMAFNSLGNTEHIRSFWRQKLNALRVGRGASYAETSHFPGKAGLIENLPYLAKEKLAQEKSAGDTPLQIHVVYLYRDELEVAWSLYNRFDYYNRGWSWLFYLDPLYPRNIVNSQPYLDYSGGGGVCLWYCREMAARAEYYRRLLSRHENIHFYPMDLKDLTDKNGFATLMRECGMPTRDPLRHQTEKHNVNKQWFFTEENKQGLKKIADSIPFDKVSVIDDRQKQGHPFISQGNYEYRDFP